MITVLCSVQDPASQNIKNNLLQMHPWSRLGFCSGYDVYELKKFRIVEIGEMHIYQDGIDKKLEECSLDTRLIIVASKHRSKDERKLLTVHFTGNVEEAKFGGRPRELAVAAPQAARSLLRSLKMLTRNEDYEVSLEATHHGPSELKTPSVYVEIGSTEREWADVGAGRHIANAILMLKENDAPVAVGFGGNHYAPRQTKLVCETDIAFGHIFPSYNLDKLDRDMLKQAFDKSKADFAYFDRKSMNAEQRERIGALVEGLGFEVLRESDIRAMDGVPWEFCLQLRDKAKSVCSSGHARLTQGIRCEINKLCQGCVCPRVKVARIDPELLREAEKLDRSRLKMFLEEHSVAYLEYEDGRFAHVVIGIDDNCARLVAEKLTEVCVDILKEHYLVKYDSQNTTLYLMDKRFSPDRAKEFGIESGPLYGQLANGKAVEINGKTILSEMVFEIDKKAIKLKYVPLKQI